MGNRSDRFIMEQFVEVELVDNRVKFNRIEHPKIFTYEDKSFIATEDGRLVLQVPKQLNKLRL